MKDFADAPQEVLDEEHSHRVIRWLELSTIAHATRDVFVMPQPLVGRATAAGRLSLRTEIKTAEHAD